MVRVARAASALFFVVVAGLLIQRPVERRRLYLLIPALSVPRKTVKSSPNCWITSGANGNGITVNHDDVIIRNVEILHAGGHDILLRGADRTRIQNVNIRYTNAPSAGANTGQHNNIQCRSSADVVITRVRLRDGSSGIHTIACPRVHVSFVEGYNFRGRSLVDKSYNSIRAMMLLFKIFTRRTISTSHGQRITSILGIPRIPRFVAVL